jgi:hypothetical protein
VTPRARSSDPGVGEHAFAAALEIVGINPFVRVPTRVLAALLRVAGRDRGPIPIAGTLNGQPYRQTLVRFRGMWRLYVNMQMLPDSPRRVGERLSVTIRVDRAPRTIAAPAAFIRALAADAVARATFERLSPSRQGEIVRSLARLKSTDALARNVERAVRFLRGEGSFAGRAAP